MFVWVLTSVFIGVLFDLWLIIVWAGWPVNGKNQIGEGIAAKQKGWSG
jgi:hypothetical protein